MEGSDMLRKLKEHLDNTPREQLLKEWEEAEKATAGIISPTIEEFLSWQGVRMAPERQVQKLICKVQPIEPMAILFSAESYDDKAKNFLSC